MLFMESSISCSLGSSPHAIVAALRAKSLAFEQRWIGAKEPSQNDSVSFPDGVVFSTASATPTPHVTLTSPQHTPSTSYHRDATAAEEGEGRGGSETLEGPMPGTILQEIPQLFSPFGIWSDAEAERLIPSLQLRHSYGATVVFFHLSTLLARQQSFLHTAPSTASPSLFDTCPSSSAKKDTPSWSKRINGTSEEVEKRMEGGLLEKVEDSSMKMEVSMDESILEREALQSCHLFSKSVVGVVCGRHRYPLTPEWPRPHRDHDRHHPHHSARIGTEGPNGVHAEEVPFTASSTWWSTPEGREKIKEELQLASFLGVAAVLVPPLHPPYFSLCCTALSSSSSLGGSVPEVPDTKGDPRGPERPTVTPPSSPCETLRQNPFREHERRDDKEETPIQHSSRESMEEWEDRRIACLAADVLLPFVRANASIHVWVEVEMALEVAAPPANPSTGSAAPLDILSSHRLREATRRSRLQYVYLREALLYGYHSDTYFPLAPYEPSNPPCTLDGWRCDPLRTPRKTTVRPPISVHTACSIAQETAHCMQLRRETLSSMLPFLRWSSAWLPQEERKRWGPCIPPHKYQDSEGLAAAYERHLISPDRLRVSTAWLGEPVAGIEIHSSLFFSPSFFHSTSFSSLHSPPLDSSSPTPPSASRFFDAGAPIPSSCAVPGCHVPPSCASVSSDPSLISSEEDMGWTAVEASVCQVEELDRLFPSAAQLWGGSLPAYLTPLHFVVELLRRRALPVFTNALLSSSSLCWRKGNMMRKNVALPLSSPAARAVSCPCSACNPPPCLYPPLFFPSFTCLQYVYQRLVLDVERTPFHAYENTLQLPLQPLADCLCSQVYEIFEKDEAKYIQYYRAIEAYIADWCQGAREAEAATPEEEKQHRIAALGVDRHPPCRKSTAAASKRRYLRPHSFVYSSTTPSAVMPALYCPSRSSTSSVEAATMGVTSTERGEELNNDAVPRGRGGRSNPSSEPLTLYITILGCGRGPLIEQCLRACDARGVRAQVFAIEKNKTAAAYTASKWATDPSCIERLQRRNVQLPRNEEGDQNRRAGTRQEVESVRRAHAHTPAAASIKKERVEERNVGALSQHEQPPLEHTMAFSNDLPTASLDQSPLSTRTTSYAITTAPGVCSTDKGQDPFDGCPPLFPVLSTHSSPSRSAAEKSGPSLSLPFSPSTSPVLPHVLHVIYSDGRSLWGDAQARTRLPPAFGWCDLVVSELLGSFGDNELSPECLEGFYVELQHIWREKHIPPNPFLVSIPMSYTSWVAPVHSTRFEISLSETQMKGLTVWIPGSPGNRHAAIPHQLLVSHLMQGLLLAPPQPLWTFYHFSSPLRISSSTTVSSSSCTAPQQEEPCATTDMDREACCVFRVPSDRRLSGIMGFFQAELYTPLGEKKGEYEQCENPPNGEEIHTDGYRYRRDDERSKQKRGGRAITLCTLPHKRTKGLFSWFPCIFPLPLTFPKEFPSFSGSPLVGYNRNHLYRDRVLSFRIQRCTNAEEKRVWYSWDVKDEHDVPIIGEASTESADERDEAVRIPVRMCEKDDELTTTLHNTHTKVAGKVEQGKNGTEAKEKLRMNENGWGSSIYM